MKQYKIAWKSLTLGLLLLFSNTSWSAPATTLTDVKTGNVSENSTRVRFLFSNPVPLAQVKTFVLQQPNRVVLTFDSTQLSLNTKPSTVEKGLIETFQVVEAGDRTRAVVTLNHNATYQLSTFKNFVDLTLIAQASKENNMVFSANEDTKNHSIKNVDFHRGPHGNGEIIITTSDPNLGINVHQQAGQMQADFLNTQIAPALERRLDVRDFGTPVQFVLIHSQGNNVTVKLESTGIYEQMAYQVEDNFIIDIRPLTPAEIAKRKKPVYKGDRLSLNFQNIDVRAVLQLLAEFTGLNVVVSDTVQGSMTLRLHNVPWDQALDIILTTRGLDKREFGNVLLIAPQAEIASREKQELQNVQQVQDLAPLIAELIQINYAKALDIATLLKTKDTSLLSPRGNVRVDERTNTLWIQDTASKLRDVRDLITKLDIPVRQVLIEARVVTIERNYEKELGVKFGLSRPDVPVSGTLDGANTIASNLLTSDMASIPALASTAVADRLNVDLPTGTGGGRFGLALASIGEGTYLDLELSALESEGLAQILANPRLVTSNQQSAHIETGEEIPYQEQSSSGGTTTAFKKAVLSLTVTPQITPDGNIALVLKVTQDTRGDQISANTPPAINTREIETQVLVDNGQTIVLGGVYEQTKRNDVDRVPFLGKLPVVGRLFRYNHDLNNRRELLIFVTPRIVENSVFHQ